MKPLKKANVNTGTGKNFNSYTAAQAGSKSKRRKKYAAIVSDTIENYITSGEFAKDFQYLPSKEKVEIALHYRFFKAENEVKKS